MLHPKNYGKIKNIKKVIQGISKPRSKQAKINLSKAAKQSYIDHLELRIKRRDKMIKRIEEGYDPTQNRIQNGSCGWGNSGFFNKIYYASNLELKRIKFFFENKINFNRYILKKFFIIKYIHPQDNIERNYFPDFVIDNYIEEIKYSYHITKQVLEKYRFAFLECKKNGYNYYITCEKDYNKLPAENYNSQLNINLRSSLNLK